MSNISFTQDNLWGEWMKEKNNDTANQIIEKHFYLVNYHVQRIAAHLPSSVSKEDLRSLGLYGLYDALVKFDPNRDLKFDTYASFRIRGAIIDGLRKEDWLPRSARDKAKNLERVSQVLEQKLHRQPTTNELASELNLSTSEVEEVIKDNLFANLLSIEEKTNDSKDEWKEGIGYTLPDNKNPLPETHIIMNENYQDLEIEIKQLNNNEQMVISLFYKEELTFTEIGHVLELTTSRISQIHKQAIIKLRKSLSRLHER
ncbi:FliA/WhiG family RNA polymerase sigma factor [Aquibacillus koreensis]|uniref:FliA/WhiG family RNA polymerase sigma factor n=1 Tax=Aquibacillus koreensis TaxID=279446 RepID=A0A9X3WR28_9BACI|nr:FliA/WhiG family RNA polymerase sigma factor [Aquibacillus koreensis]MCT2534547.1 FliA/WhiG family RNA polymerase sigma factor [Aquibacillus koreensis]MDC3421859.1 FliA/WhiG family RNA polymerase sigma factor [Aquibacillus koreensis]